jgi:predicted secreted protein
VKSEDNEELAKEAECREKLMHYIIKNNIQILQLPCPEFIIYGPRRWGQVKDQFNHSFYRKQCREMLEPIIMQIKNYMALPEQYQIMGVVAVDGSPSCGYRLTCRGDWGGELSGMVELHKKIENLSMTSESGVFMEELIELFNMERIDIPIKDLSQIVQELC